MRDSVWHQRWNSRVLFKEPVHMIEACSILGGVKHRSRDHLRHRRKILILNDNMSVVLALQKGRCHNFGLLGVIRTISAHALATGQRYHVRWLASELNVADKGSRQWEAERRRSPHGRRSEAQAGGGGLQQKPSEAAQPEDEESVSGSTAEEKRSRSTSRMRERTGVKVANSDLKQHLRQVEKKRRKATERQKKFLKKLRAHSGERTILEIHPVKEPQRTEYSRRLEEFYNFVPPVEHPHRTAAGHVSQRLCRRAVSGWRRVPRWRKAEGRSRVQETGVDEEWPHESAAIQEGNDGLEETCTATNPASNDRVCLKGCVSGLVMEMCEKEMGLFNETSYSTYPGQANFSD